MDLTPKLLTEGTDFQQVRRGYDPDEVDDFLERVAAAVSRLQGQLVEANRRAEIAEAAAARTPTSEPDHPALDEMQRTLVLAQRTADAAVREAREEADTLVASARREAATILTNGRQEADRYAAETRLTLSGEVRELEQQRESLLDDLTSLERHVEAQRTRIRMATEELQRVVDDPDAFRVERPEGFEPRPAPSPEPVQVAAAPEPTPEPVPVAAAPEPEPAPEPERQLASGSTNGGGFAPDPTPAEVGSSIAPAETVPGPPPVPVMQAEPQPQLQPSVSSAFGPPPGPNGGVQTMPSPAAVAAVAPEQSPDALIDLTHERPLPEGQDEDAFLAELRKAMTDDEPLGPREEPPGVVRTIGEVPLGRQRGRFGRRR
ncbi:MAG: DivIVA domain-containing protein [Acidimicrobiia bacterium]|nr:DivIVA domain-containing protein [Acidimicrobiia bacterium]